MNKKHLLAISIMTVLSQSAFAENQTEETSPESLATGSASGISYSVPVGPFYDPLIGGGLAVIPTAIYTIDEGAKPSTSSLTFMYSTSSSWIAKFASENYFGSESQWMIDTELGVSYAEIDFVNFMGGFGIPGVSNSTTAELHQDTIEFNLTAAYKIFDKTYFGPFIEYKKFTQERFESSPFASSNMLPDGEELNYGVTLTYDDRNELFNTSDGLYISLNARQVEREDTGGNILQTPNFTLDMNGEKSYLQLVSDIRYYQPITKDTSFAVRSKIQYKGDEASDTASTLYAVANGFTHESGGRSAAGLDLELRHWFTDKIGMVGGISAGKPIDAGNRDDSVKYAGIIGLRYMILPEHGLAARLDAAFNTQDEDNIIGYFNVGHTF